jgi:hypothetical protein
MTVFLVMLREAAQNSKLPAFTQLNCAGIEIDRKALKSLKPQF